MLLDYIHGTAAAELREAKGSSVGSFGTPNQDRRFRQQMASIHVSVSKITFNQIGSIYLDEETSDFFIGPEVETGKGPWTSSADYYIDMANHALEVCASLAEAEVYESSSFAVPIIFTHLMSLYGNRESTGGPFHVVNRDFGAHNILVNDDFEVVGVIDFDGVMAAPIEVLPSTRS